MEKNLNIIIIGSSSGLGKQLALTYGKYQNIYLNEKINFFLVSRRKILLDELKKQLTRKDRNIEILVKDITDEDSANVIINKALEFFNKIKKNKIDHLICNAGIMIKGKQEDLTLDIWEKLYKTNYLSHREIIEFAINNDALEYKANIAITNSIEGKRYLATPNNFFGAYGKSKKLFEIWIINVLRPQNKNKYNITVIYPSLMDGEMYLNIRNTKNEFIDRDLEWKIFELNEPVLQFNKYSLEIMANRYYFAIINNRDEEYSSIVDKFILKIPDPFFNFIFYLYGIYKNMGLFDIPFYLILQFWNDINLFAKIISNNFYIKDNIININDIENKNYRLTDFTNNNHEYLLKRYQYLNYGFFILLFFLFKNLFL